MSIGSTGLSDYEFHGMQPLAVPVKVACTLLGVGNTTMYALIKSRRVQTVNIGRRRLVIYASLKALVHSEDGAKS